MCENVIVFLFNFKKRDPRFEVMNECQAQSSSRLSFVDASLLPIFGQTYQDLTSLIHIRILCTFVATFKVCSKKRLNGHTSEIRESQKSDWYLISGGGGGSAGMKDREES